MHESKEMPGLGFENRRSTTDFAVTSAGKAAATPAGEKVSVARCGRRRATMTTDVMRTRKRKCVSACPWCPPIAIHAISSTAGGAARRGY